MTCMMAIGVMPSHCFDTFLFPTDISYHRSVVSLFLCFFFFFGFPVSVLMASSGAELVRFPVHHRTIFASKASGGRLDLSESEGGEGEVEYDCPHLIIRVKKTFQRIIGC